MKKVSKPAMISEVPIKRRRSGFITVVYYDRELRGLKRQECKMSADLSKLALGDCSTPEHFLHLPNFRVGINAIFRG